MAKHKTRPENMTVCFRAPRGRTLNTMTKEENPGKSGMIGNMYEKVILNYIVLCIRLYSFHNMC